MASDFSPAMDQNILGPYYPDTCRVQLLQLPIQDRMAWFTGRLNSSWQSDVAQPEVEVFLEANGPQDDLCHDWLTHFSAG